MDIKVEKLSGSKVELTVNVDPEKLNEGINHSYNKNKGKYHVPGFRKGKVPKQIIERTYGAGIFLEDAINYILDDVYTSALKKTDLRAVSQPDVEIVDIDEKTGAVLKFVLFVEPDVKLGQYKNIEVPKQIVFVSEEEVEKKIAAVQEKNSRLIAITDRPVKMGDTVTIDFEGSIDGVPFDGGKDENFDLVIGSKTFIDTFEEQLIGCEINSKVTVNVAFPEEYHSSDLSGKPAQFDVYISEIKEKEFPPIDDDFAQDVSEFNTLDEYKQDIRDKLYHEKTKKAEIEKELYLLNTIVDASDMEIPDIMVDNEVTALINRLENNLLAQRLNLDTYLKHIGQTMESLRNYYRETAIDSVCRNLILRQISIDEDITVTKDEIDEYIGELTGLEGEALEAFVTKMPEEEFLFLQDELKLDKALKLVEQTSIEI